jgi:PAS domain S-box-containing protein
VDDEESLLNVSKEYLHLVNKEIKITAVKSAQEALTKLDQEEFDIIVSDYMMPEMDGLRLLATLRQSDNDIPFIVYTGRSREEIVIEALNLGANFFMKKEGQPRSQFTELAHLIQTAVDHARAHRELRESVEQYRLVLDSMTDPLNVVDEDFKVILVNPAHIQRAKKLGVDTNPIGKDILEAFPFLSERIRDEIKQVFSTRGTVVTYESVNLDGKELFTETRKIPIFRKGEVIQVLTIVHEFSEFPIKEK